MVAASGLDQPSMDPGIGVRAVDTALRVIAAQPVDIAMHCADDGRAIAGSHDYAQIPALIERSKLRVANFYSDMEARLAEAPFVAGEHFSAADITSLVTVDFAARAFEMPIATEMHALKRWYVIVAVPS